MSVEALRSSFFWTGEGLGVERMSAAEEMAVLHLLPPFPGARPSVPQLPLPAHVDWSTDRNPIGRAVVTPPINQGHCGGCWSIVSASVVESAVAIARGLLTPLSAQELLDCDTSWNAGCLGGNPIQSFDWIKAWGLTTAASYPYEARQLPCRRKDVDPVSSIHGYRVLRSFDENVLKAAVARQPVAVGIAGQHPSFLFYQGGIYDDEDCGSTLNHALVVVGYGTDEKTGLDYWLCKNSWGPHWGEHGFVRIRRQASAGGDTGPGICGLAVAPSIPMGAYGGNNTAWLEANKSPGKDGKADGKTDSHGQNAGGKKEDPKDKPPAKPLTPGQFFSRALPGLLGIVAMLLILTLASQAFGQQVVSRTGGGVPTTAASRLVPRRAGYQRVGGGNEESKYGAV